MTFTLGLAQCRHPVDVRAWAREARDAGVDLLVFPEALMTRYEGSPERFRAQAQRTDGAFARGVDVAAAETGLWIVYTMNEANELAGANKTPEAAGVTGANETVEPAEATGASGATGAAEANEPASDRAPFNTAIVVGTDGVQRARYRKVHLFDAQGYRESDYLTAGDELMRPIETPFATLGLAICYDLRFPEVARAAALAGAQLMAYPAAWVAGPGKVMQWETLLRARAIENGMFVAGASSADVGRIGQSRVYAPDGSLVAAGGDGEQLVTCAIDLCDIERVRSATPSLQHRRVDCYGAP